MKTLLRMSMILAVAAPAAAAKKPEDLSSMIIQGENRLRAEPRVPAVVWDPAVYRDVQGITQDYSMLGELKPPAIQEPPVILPERLDTDKTASPWLERILTPPVLRVAFNPPENVKKAAAEWAFLIKGSNGQVFYEQKGKAGQGKPLPETMEWEGFSNKGEALHVGFDYAYSFSAIDEAGNPSRHAGKPFRIDAFRYSKGGDVVTSFQPELIFDGRSSLKFSKDGLDYLTEVKDFLRGRYARKLSLVVYEDDAKFAGFRVQALKAWFMKALDLPADRVEAKGLASAKGGGYRHVDVVAK